MESRIEPPPYVPSVLAQLGSCDPRALCLSAAIALGGPYLAGCDDGLPPKMPSIDSAASEARPSATPEPTLDVEAESGRIDTFEASPGFAPDPLTRRGTTAGGPIDAAEMDDRCSGFVASAPDFVFVADRPFTELRIRASSDVADTTLMIVAPDGDSHCAADGEGPDPELQVDLREGVYRIWVGTERPGIAAPFRLAITELETPLTRTLH